MLQNYMILSRRCPNLDIIRAKQDSRVGDPQLAFMDSTGKAQAVRSA